MNILDVLIVVTCVTGVLNLLFLVVLLFKIVELNSFKTTLLSQIVSSHTLLNGKLNTIEAILGKLGSSFTQFIDMTENMIDRLDHMNKFPVGMHMFQTMDGKFSAKTFEQLIEKIKKAEKQNEYLSEDELKKLKDMFDVQNEMDDEEDDDGDEDILPK
jgi:hypothetical protein